VLYNSIVPLPEGGAAELQLPEAAREDIATGLPVVGVVGRFSPEKGVDVYLDAVAELERRGVPFVSLVAGDGPERAALEAQRDALGLGARVHFIGEQKLVRPLYAVLDLLVIPSRSEGLPNVLLEAINAGVPCVSTRVGAVPEVLEGTRAGLIVERNSATALADGIEASLNLKSDPASHAARREIAHRFSLEARVQAHLQLHDDVMSAYGGKHAAAP
jgi:glycosyltransferase involved in cell wall biosynthesis